MVQPTLSEGTILARYRILGRLGAGGMGEVYKAHDSSLDRHVALKVLPASLTAKEERVRRFVQEAKAASSLSHPHIVTIHEIGEAVPESDGIPADTGPLHFIAMELVDGETLRQKFHSDKRDLRALLRYLAQAADGLAKAHAAGIIHRDLKPDNVMVTRDGFAKVLDFGLAKLTDRFDPTGETQVRTAVREETREGTVLGTVGYMSPEQVEGRVVDARSDVFSFGCILYEAITGRRPFTGDTEVDILHKILRAEPPSVTEIAPEVPSELRRIVRRCLAKDPDQRFQSMKDLSIELRDLAEEFDDLMPASGSRSSPSLVAIEAKRSARPWVIGAIAAILIAVAAIVAVLLKKPVAAPLPPDMKFTRLTSHGKAAMAQISADGRYVVYRRREAEKETMYLKQIATGSELPILPLSENQLVYGFTLSRDGNYLYVLMGARGEPYAKLFVVPTLGGGPREIVHDVDSNVALSPDEKSVAFVRPRRNEKETTLVVASTEGGGERVIATRKQPTAFARDGMAWSPDGKWIAIAEISFEGGLGRNILLISPEGKTSKTLLNPRWFFVGRLAWLPDSSGLVGSAQREEAPVTQLWMFPLEGQPRRITNDLNNYSDTSLTADGNSLVAVQTDQKSRMWRVRDGAATPVTPEGDKFGPGRVGLAADSSFIYESIVSGNLEVWRQMPNGERRQLTTHPKADYNAAISPDGTRVYFQSERNGPAEFWSMNVEGGEQRSLYRLGADVVINLSPDGKWLTYSHLRAIWRFPTTGGSPTKISDYVSTPPRYSPDGKWLIAGMAPPGVVRRLEVMIMPADGGAPRELQPPLPVTAPRESARFTPDGKSIAYVNNIKDVANVWIRPIDGEGKQVTNFTDEAGIQDFGWSSDGKDLFVIRQSTVSDVVMISQFR